MTGLLSRLALGLTTALVFVAGLMGCGGDDDSDDTSTVPATDTRAPREVVPDSPEAAIERLWRWLRLGAPTGITAYDDALVRSAGRTDMARTLMAMREPVDRTKLSVTGSGPTPIGIQITARQEAEGAEPREVLYILLRQRGKWVVAFDGLLTESLVATATSRASQQALAETRTKPGQENPRVRSATAIASAEATREVFAAIDASPPSRQVPRGVKPATSARAALDRMWNAIRSGSPAAVASYAPETVDLLGSTDMLVSLKNLGGVLTTAKVEITGIERTANGALATVRRTVEGAPARDLAYLLERRGKNWVVVYDQMLGETMVANASAQITTSAQARIDPDAAEASPAARAQGGAAGAEVQRKLATLGAPVGP